MLTKDSLELLLGLCNPARLQIDWSRTDADKAIAVARETRAELERQFKALEPVVTASTDDGA